MFILNLIRYLRGYVWFEARGVFVERFLNLVARNHIPVWSGQKRGDVYTGCVIAGDYRKLREHAKKAGVKLHVTGKKGAPFQRRRYRGRTGLVVGLVIFLGFVLGMSRFVWRIEVNGNEKLQETTILQTLEALGVRPGTLRSSIDVRDCERRLLLMLDNVSWAALNIEGSAIHVEISEATPPPPMVDPKEPCNVVAGQAGQILSMNVFDGQTLIGIGDTVLPGDIIVSGITQDQRGQSLFRHARAEVIAQVQQDVEVEIPLNQTEYVETGKTMKRRYLGVFGGELPLFLPFSIPSPYRVEREETRLTMFSRELPLTLLREEYILMEESPLIYTEEEARKLALLELSLLEKATFDDAEIVNKEIRGRLEGQVFLLNATYTCNMNIALEQKIAVDE